MTGCCADAVSDDVDMEARRSLDYFHWDPGITSYTNLSKTCCRQPNIQHTLPFRDEFYPLRS
jgi:hypothetical protein